MISLPSFEGIIRRVLNHNQMNFKSIALSALVALSTLGGAAEAAPTTCALRGPNVFREFTCDRNIRTNANGDKVNDITFINGTRRAEMSIVLWTEDGAPLYAEVFTDEGARYVTGYYIAKNGAQCIDQDDHQFCMF